MDCNGEENPCCYFHPHEVIVGICAPCLKERLLSLAAKQGHHHQRPKDTHRSFSILRRQPTIALPRIFALGSFLLRRERPDEDSSDSSISSLEESDSFISIKFEDNGRRAMWDSKQAVASLEPSSESTGSVVEHSKQLGRLRWRKRIGQLLQMARWKRSSKAGACHVAERVKGRRGWIRSLTRRRTTE